MAVKELTEHQQYVLEICRAQQTFCSTHLVDKRVIPACADRSFHQTIRRIAQERGIDASRKNPGWLSQLASQETKRHSQHFSSCSSPTSVI